MISKGLKLTGAMLATLMTVSNFCVEAQQVFVPNGCYWCVITNGKWDLNATKCDNATGTIDLIADCFNSAYFP